jgi:hypothetical protein
MTWTHGEWKNIPFKNKRKWGSYRVEFARPQASGRQMGIAQLNLGLEPLETQ